MKQHGPAQQHQRTGVDLCGRHLAEYHGMGAGHGAVASQNLVGPRTAMKLMQRDRNHRPTSVQGAGFELAGQSLAQDRVARRLGQQLSSRFARLRIRVAHRDYNLTKSRPEEWLLIEWRKVRPSRQNIGSRHFRKILPSATW